MIPYSQTLTKFQHKDTQGQLQELLEQLMILQQDTSRGSTVLVKKLERGVQSAITATASELRLEVKRTDESQRAYIDLELGKVQIRAEHIEENLKSYATVEMLEDQISATVSSINGTLQSYATVKMMSDQITAAVTDADGSYGLLKLTSNGLFVGGEKKTITSDLLDADVTKIISDAASAAESAASTASSAASSASWAASAASNAQNNIKALANGTYTGGTFISGRGLITPKLYAASGDMTQFAEMLPDGFATYHQQSGGTAYRKILLGYSNKSRKDDSGTLCPALYLGATMPLKLEKYFESGNRAWIGNEDEDCGIRFNMNTKEMTFVGTVNATISGGTTHVFA